MKNILFNFLFFVLFFTSLVYVVDAVPETGAATAVGNNNFTLAMSGASGDSWFQYGTNANNLNIWTEITASGGSITWTELGSPIQPSTHYYYVVCDITGCDPTPHTLDTLAMVPMPTSTLGTGIQNMTRSRFNLLYMPNNLLIPYGWLFPSDQQGTALALMAGMIFMFIYIGIWLRTRSVAAPVVMALLTTMFLISNTSGLQLGIPVEFMNIAQGLLYASIAGVLLAFLKK